MHTYLLHQKLRILFRFGALLTIILLAGSVWASEQPLEPKLDIYDGIHDFYLAVVNETECRTLEQRINGTLVQSNQNSCAIFPHQSQFHLIIRHQLDDQVQRVSLYAESLTLGDLTMAWGNPSYIRQFGDNQAVFIWYRNQLTIRTVINQTNNENRVRFITITHN